MSVIDSIRWDKQSSNDLVSVLGHISNLTNKSTRSTTYTASIIRLINWDNLIPNELEELKVHITDLILIKGLGLDKYTDYSSVKYPEEPTQIVGRTWRGETPLVVTDIDMSLVSNTSFEEVD